MVTHKELRSIQEAVKFDGPTMALCLNLAYDQYRKLLCGQTAIPAVVERNALELLHIEKQLDAQRLAGYEAFLSTQPNFMSEIPIGSEN